MNDKIKELLRQRAAAQVAQYPQYDAAHFEAFDTLYRVKRDIGTKLGRAFCRDEIVLGKGAPYLSNGNFYVELWSYNNAVSTTVALNMVQVLS